MVVVFEEHVCEKGRIRFNQIATTNTGLLEVGDGIRWTSIGAYDKNGAILMSTEKIYNAIKNDNYNGSSGSVNIAADRLISYFSGKKTERAA